VGPVAIAAMINPALPRIWP